MFDNLKSGDEKEIIKFAEQLIIQNMVV